MDLGKTLVLFFFLNSEMRYRSTRFLCFVKSIKLFL